MHSHEPSRFAMRRGARPLRAALAAAGLFMALAAPASIAAPKVQPDLQPDLAPGDVARVLRLSPLPAPPPNETNRVADDERAARLGQRLFFDARLSFDGRFSCATCHDPAKAFTDGRALPEARAPLRRNVPSLLDVAHQRWLNWDGSADSLWAQALRPIENPAEMGGDRVSVARLVAGDPILRRDYETIFGALPSVIASGSLPERARPAALPSGLLARPPGPDAAGAAATDGGLRTREAELTAAWAAMPQEDRAAVDLVFANVGKAIEAYERRLRSGPSSFDRFVEALRAGDDAGRTAMSASAQRGLALFMGVGNCRLCHGGPALSDGEFHSLGVPPAPDPLAAPAAPAGGAGVPASGEGGDGPTSPGPQIDPGRYEGLRILGLDPFGAGGPFSDRRDGPRAARVASLAKGPESWGQFRTPSLRNVARTAPYMHAGQMATLEDVVRFYSTHEGRVVAGHHRETILEPLHLEPGQIRDLGAFLEALSGSDPEPRWLVAPPATP